MGLLSALGVRIAAKTASDTIIKVAARLTRDRQKYIEGYKAGYKDGVSGKDPKE
jgi:hypothetical protein